MSLDFKKLTENLHTIYQNYELDAAQFKEQAVCSRGCSFCCTVVGKIDIVTIEGLILLERLESMPEPEAKRISQRLEKDRESQLKGKKTACPFLDDQEACLVYDVRSFSCRQLYSLRRCDQNGPLVHKQAFSLAQKVVREIQQLDYNGYSGHYSFILQLLQNEVFRKTYSSGCFDPGRIQKFGKKHGIIINRFAK
jgi:Fe-S-cluster containining protein